jgi:hypothetical protein
LQHRDLIDAPNHRESLGPPTKDGRPSRAASKRQTGASRRSMTPAQVHFVPLSQRRDRGVRVLNRIGDSIAVVQRHRAANTFDDQSDGGVGLNQEQAQVSFVQGLFQLSAIPVYRQRRCLTPNLPLVTSPTLVAPIQAGLCDQSPRPCCRQCWQISRFVQWRQDKQVFLLFGQKLVQAVR